MRLPIIHALISLVLHLAALELFFYGFDLGIYSMVYANILFAVFMCILNAVSLKKHLKYRQEIRKTILLPAAASAVMGAAAFGAYQLFYRVCGSNLISTVFSILLAILVYGVLLIKFGCLDQDELRRMPGGTRLLGLLKRVRLM